MQLSDLIAAASAGDISCLEILSLEGSLYLLRAVRGDEATTVTDGSGRALRARSPAQFRDMLSACPRLPCFLVQQVAHDEMCGERVAPPPPLRLPIA